LLNGIFVAAEFSIVAAPRTRIAQKAEHGSKIAQDTLKIQIDPVLQNRYITTAQVGITVVSLGLGMYGEHAIAEWLLRPLEKISFIEEAAIHTIATFASIGLLTYIHVVLGEMIPKSLALQSPEPTVMTLARPMALIQKGLYPIVWSLNKLGDLVVRFLGIPNASKQSRLFTSEELEFIVDESSESGLLEPAEQLFIQNILDLQDRTVEHVMTPRTKVIGIPVSVTDKETILRIICDTRKSRYPVYIEDLDQVTGILHIKDLARFMINNPGEPINIGELARKAAFIPDSVPLDKMLPQFRSERIQLAIVVDEFGGTSGIISLEDLQEEVVGEIQDEYDQEIPIIEEISEKVLRVRGDLILDELEQLYDLDLEHEEAYTIGGLVMTLLGRIPHPNDKVDYKGVKIEVETTERLAVQSVIIFLPNISSDSEDTDE